MPANVTLRQAQAGDADAISALVRGLLRHLVAEPADPAIGAFVEALGHAATLERVTSPRFRYVVAECDGELLGVAALRDGTHLYHLFVREALHQRGIGRALWEWVRAEATGKRITVNATLSAVPVYTRLGFTATNSVQRTDGLEFLPMVFDRDAVG